MADVDHNTAAEGQEIDEQIVVPVPSSMKTQVRVAAARKGISMSELVRRAVRELDYAEEEAVPA
jgi:Arc/MetJ-type ribon-helix-helix transcriptional regulator